MSEEKPKHLRFYYDERCTVEADTVIFTRPVQAGAIGIEKLFMRNVGGDRCYDIHIIPQDPESDATPMKTRLESGEITPVEFKWNPSAERETALKTQFNIQYKRLIV